MSTDVSCEAQLTILGLGVASPRHDVDQALSAEMASAFCGDGGGARLLPTLYRHSGVKRRGSVLVEEGPRQDFFLPAAEPTTRQRMERYALEAAPLALAATRTALQQATIKPDEIRHLVTVSCTGFAAPGWDVALVKQLGLPPEVSRTHVGFMGCHGAFNALRAARGLSLAAGGEPALVCAAELCSLHFAYGCDPQQMVANALFADGAGAVIVRAASCSHSRPQQVNESWTIASHASILMPDSEDGMTWRIGDHGFEMSLSPRVPDLIRENVRPWLTSWLATNGLNIPGVRSWAVHPGGPRILGAVADALGVTRDEMATSFEVLRGCGNMSSPTVLFILDRLRKGNASRPCVALGFGPGLAAEAMLIR
ncbi:MAG: type III polyketide synthase [Phycisphaeraceae bacterium]|nr:type III polyketide synthase [Phycisphaeraceae bacterium]